jgi:hypothetical protein
MLKADLLHSLIFKINEYQLALETAIMKLMLGVEKRGSGQVGGTVREALETIPNNEEFINTMLAELMTPEDEPPSWQRRTADIQ